MSTTRTRNGVTVTVGNMTGKPDALGGWVVEEILINGEKIDHKSQAWQTEEDAFLRAFSIANTEIDKLKRR
ncbi:hypothetical protein LH705_12175 [Pseudomonas putida]|jgi:hypothetical protein|uniref:hypothetical protein n=1 Tax=Pseudomonas putida TaxID=303 RepID=UPI001F3168FA|nr:hypothetical protein [Pseudomonas putida]MCF1250317.1 hypothetical protein [Pseudomonas putida]